MDPLKTYDYLMKAREQVLAAVRPLTPEQYRREFGIGLRTIASTLTHIMISEGYYVDRLAGRGVPPYDQWPIKYEDPPAFEIVESAWRKQARASHTFIESERDWKRTIAWDSFPDERGKRFHIRTTAGDIVTQLVLHEVHHRAQVMAMLRGLGDGIAPLEDLDYNALMYARRPLD